MAETGVMGGNARAAAVNAAADTYGAEIETPTTRRVVFSGEYQAGLLRAVELLRERARLLTNGGRARMGAAWAKASALEVAARELEREAGVGA
jgi:hypothetical protein